MVDLKQAGAKLVEVQEKGLLSALFPGASFSQVEFLCAHLVDVFLQKFGVPQKISLASAPGCVELMGGAGGSAVFMAAAPVVNGCAAKNGQDTMRLCREDGEWSAGLARDARFEPGTPATLARGVAEYFSQNGYPVGGADVFLTSTTPPGMSGEAAALGGLFGVLLSDLYCAGAVPPDLIAEAGLYAQKYWAGNPCSPGEYLAAAFGGAVLVDEAGAKKRAVRRFAPDLEQYALCLVETGEPPAAAAGLEQIARFFGKPDIHKVGEPEFFCEYARLREKFGDAAVLRGCHAVTENSRVRRAARALEQRDTAAFLALAGASGRSALRADGTGAAAAAACDHLLAGRGTLRVLDGGARLLALVPADLLEKFRVGLETMLGPGLCAELETRGPGVTVVL